MNIYDEWADVANKLRALKKEERKLRNKIEDEIRANGPRFGTAMAELGGHVFKSNVTLRYSIDAQVFLDNEWQMSEEELGCIDMKPAINVARYKKLPDDSMLRKLVEVKPNAPQLSIEE